MLSKKNEHTDLNDITELMNNEKIFKSLNGYLQLQQLYRAAIKEICTKLEILDEEFKVRYNDNPIHHIESRLKSPKSIVEKLARKGYAVDIDSAREHIMDIAGIRVICCYLEDIYKIADLLLKQNDITLIEKKDYIKNPKPNGYRSLHLVISIPIFLSDGVENVPIEVQVRSVAMDFWASLEHHLRYKQAECVPDGVSEQLFDCAQTIAELDTTMQSIYTRLHPKSSDARQERN